MKPVAIRTRGQGLKIIRSKHKKNGRRGKVRLDNVTKSLQRQHMNVHVREQLPMLRNLRNRHHNANNTRAPGTSATTIKDAESEGIKQKAELNISAKNLRPRLPELALLINSKKPLRVQCPMLKIEKLDLGQNWKSIITPKASNLSAEAIENEQTLNLSNSRRYYQGPTVPAKVNVVKDAKLLAKIQRLLPTVVVVKLGDEEILEQNDNEVAIAVENTEAGVATTASPAEDASNSNGNCANSPQACLQLPTSLAANPDPVSDDESQKTKEVSATPIPPRSPSPAACHPPQVMDAKEPMNDSSLSDTLFPSLSGTPPPALRLPSPIPSPTLLPGQSTPPPPIIFHTANFHRLLFPTLEQRNERNNKRLDPCFFLHMGRYHPEDSCFNLLPPVALGEPLLRSTSTCSHNKRSQQREGNDAPMKTRNYHRNTRSNPVESSELASNAAAYKDSYVCVQCGQDFPHKSGLVLHQSTHMERNAYRCCYCHVHFYDKRAMDEHIVSDNCRPRKNVNGSC